MLHGVGVTLQHSIINFTAFKEGNAWILQTAPLLIQQANSMFQIASTVLDLNQFTTNGSRKRRASQVKWRTMVNLMQKKESEEECGIDRRGPLRIEKLVVGSYSSPLHKATLHIELLFCL
jgi:hypothetical protein